MPASACFFTSVELIALDLGDQSLAADPERLGELGFVPARLAKALGEHPALDLFEDLVERLVDPHALHVGAHRALLDAGGEELGVEGLEELVRKSAQKALPEMKQAILDGVAEWRHGPLTDDMSLVLVELR